MPLSGSYNYVLVALSIFIGMSASYAAIDLAGRVTSTTGWLRHAWLGGGAIAMGIGIWSMHFTGMQAFSLPVPINYNWPTVLISLLAGIAAAGFSLFVVSRQTMGFIRIVSASIIMGAAIIAVHYVGMDAMRLAAECRYNMVIVTLSALLAVLASFVGLWLSFHFRDEAEGVGWRKILGAVVAGTAISSMHYTGMAAASFFPSTAAPDLSHAVRISMLGVVAVALATLIVQGLAVLTSFVDRRFAAQKAELLSSQILHVQEEERRRIARDLHDDLGQALFGANLKLGQVPKFVSDDRALKILSETQSLLGSCVDKLRTLAHLLHPPELETAGLRTAIVVCVDGFRERSGIQVTLELPEHFPRLTPSAENALFKVVQECLLNIQRHSKSAKALIHLEARPDEVRLEVRDEGVGIEHMSSRAPDHSGPKFGVGLAGMSERIKRLGGRLEITSGSWGTSVKVILPVGKLES
jgi:signal transduction histidine kinase